MTDAMEFLAGGGEAARMIREREWSDHPLGPPAGWSAEFRAALSLILNSPESMILAWGPDLHFFFNDTYFPLLGPRLAWAMGERFDRVWADGWEQAKPIIDAAMAGQPKRFVDLPWTLETDRGNRRTWWSFSYSRVLDARGAIAGLFIFTNETTARVLSDDALHRSQEQLAALNTALEQQVAERTQDRNLIWQVSRELLVVTDSEGRILRINPAWTRVLGWQEHDLIGRTSEWLEHPDDRAKTRDIRVQLAELDTDLTLENRLRCTDGTYRTVSWTAVPVEGQFYCSGRDVTSEREQAAVLATAEEALRQSQKMEAVGQLTGGVAHDFNNLLTIIRSSVDFLRRPDLAEQRKARYLDAVSETVDRAAKLTGQLLAFARRQSLKPEVFDVGVKLRGLAEMLDTVTGSRIKVTTRVPDNPCGVRADITQFETAVINMAVNARDAMDGEGQLTLRLECGVPMPPIRGHAGSRTPFAAVSVIDTGSGIAPDNLARIFEPFFTTKEVGKGTGLGLSQVFGFAKQSGGDVDVQSVVGEGTAFTLYLPEEQTEVCHASSEEADVTQAPTGGGQRVLVVEDNIEVGRFCTQILEDLGYLTEWVANAEAALDRLGAKGGGFDVVFSDVVMPGMGGVALAQTLRTHLPTLPVILASGYSHVLAREADHGFELLHKPYSADQLARVLQRVLSKAGTLSQKVGPSF